MNFKDIVTTPSYVIDEKQLIKNCEILDYVQKRTGAKILLAQKAYSNYSTYPLIKKYLCGTTASSLNEARLGFEKFGKETHIFSAAYKDSEFDEIVSLCDHIVFNTPSQVRKYHSRLNGKSCGIRINPEYSEIETDLYNPCFKNSRLGTTLKNFDEDILELIDGLHFHTMCEQNSDTLKRTINAVENKFGKYMHNMKWINFGGGHHITRDDYDVDTLIECIDYIKNKYNVEVYLEPGEAVALNAGYFVCEVLEIMNNEMDILITDGSAACHMPDVLEMPYRPRIVGADDFGKLKYSYRIGSQSCLAGDVIGDYSFNTPLSVGDRLVFEDMAIYTTVKNNTFNGINLPSIYVLKADNTLELVREFGYNDFKNRL